MVIIPSLVLRKVFCIWVSCPSSRGWQRGPGWMWLMVFATRLGCGWGGKTEVPLKTLQREDIPFGLRGEGGEQSPDIWGCRPVPPLQPRLRCRTPRFANVKMSLQGDANLRVDNFFHALSSLLPSLNLAVWFGLIFFLLAHLPWPLTIPLPWLLGLAPFPDPSVPLFPHSGHFPSLLFPEGQPIAESSPQSNSHGKKWNSQASAHPLPAALPSSHSPRLLFSLLSLVAIKAAWAAAQRANFGRCDHIRSCRNQGCPFII